MAKMVKKKLATEELNSELMEPYNACRIFPLGKKPGLRPIGIGEVEYLSLELYWKKKKNFLIMITKIGLAVR